MQCPSCHQEVDVKDKDVGALFTCPLCRSVYFINFDGTPEYGELEQPSEEDLKKLQNLAIPEKKKKKQKKKNDNELEQQPSVVEEAFAEESEEPLTAEVEDPPADVPVMEMPPFELNSSLEDFNQPAEGFSLEISSTEQAPDVTTMPSEVLPAENSLYETAPMGDMSSQDFMSIASEIETFGNQQTAVAGISYDLEITGLDTKDSQELLREAISDSRFGWHPDDIVREIRTGTCRFKDLTPVQAFVLAKRIQFIDLEMKWKQNVLA